MCSFVLFLFDEISIYFTLPSSPTVCRAWLGGELRRGSGCHHTPLIEWEGVVWYREERTVLAVGAVMRKTFGFTDRLRIS